MTQTIRSPFSMACKICDRSAPDVEFYPSIATYCKEHWREKVRLNRNSKAEYYRAYDRERGSRQDIGYLREYRAANPKKYKAHGMVARALRAGKMYPMPCLVCGKDAEAHHPDYDQPLDVIWLCPAHHKEVHGESRRMDRRAA
jgi:hypothetical protein